jgi:leader peptidase (prepilin peptidase) / N-methyltransferase
MARGRSRTAHFRTVSAAILVATLLGALLGAGADRLAARWPAHHDGRVRRLDWRSAVVVVGSAAAFGALAGRWPDARDLAVLGIYVAALIVLLATDLDQKLLPDVITLPLVAYALVVLLLGWNPMLAGKDLAFVTAIAAGLGAPILLLITDRLFGGALGMGDVKLAVSLGLMAGISRFVGGFIIASALSAIVLIVLIAMRRITLRTAIPFGPILIAGGVVATLLPG